MRALHLIVALVVGVSAAAETAQNAATRTFTGVVTDSECPDANHARMRMGNTDPECVTACVDAHAATYVLFDGKVAWELTDQGKAATYAAKKVTVTGTVATGKNRIQVESITATP
jgi:hypothetical protein